MFVAHGTRNDAVRARHSTFETIRAIPATCGDRGVDELTHLPVILDPVTGGQAQSGAGAVAGRGRGGADGLLGSPPESGEGDERRRAILDPKPIHADDEDLDPYIQLWKASRMVETERQFRNP